MVFKDFKIKKANLRPVTMNKVIKIIKDKILKKTKMMKIQKMMTNSKENL